MDTVALITVLGSCSHLALRSVALVADFARLKDKLRHVERDVQMVVTQINAIKGVANQLSQWLQQNPTSTTMELLPELSGVLDCCLNLVALIGQHVDKVKGTTKLKLKAGVAQLLGEEKLKEYQHILQGQLQALSLLIQCLQLRSPSERKSLVQLVEKNTTFIHGRFEFNAKQPSPRASPSMRPFTPEQSGRKDSVLAPMSPLDLRLEGLTIEASSPQDEHPNFFRNMPRPTADLKVGTERRCYATSAPLPKVDPYAGTEDEDDDPQHKGFGLKFLGKISRKSVIQFDKLTMPQVLMDWPQWHREQRNKATKEGRGLTAVLNSGLYTAVRLKHIDYINELFDNGARETARSGAGWTLIHHAVMFADERILTLLLERRVDPNLAIDRHGTPLHYAIHHEDEKAVQILLSHGADPNALDTDSHTPLYFALRYLLALDHTSKQNDPKWPFGKSADTRSAVCYSLRPGVRHVLLLLLHGAQPSSHADELRWSSSIQQKLANTHTRNLPDLIAFLADPLAPGIPEAVVDVYLWIQHALKDSLREAARGSIPVAAVAVRAMSKDSSSSGGSVKSVRFEEQPRRAQGQQNKKTLTAMATDAERLEQLLGLT